eukprot:3070-Heterococcus_DN1.PRE.4
MLSPRPRVHTACGEGMRSTVMVIDGSVKTARSELDKEIKAKKSKRRDSQHGSTATSSAQPAFTTTGAALATQSAQVLAATAADAEKARRRKSYSTDVRESSIGLL